MHSMIRPFHSKRIRIAGRQLGLCLSLLLLTLTASSAVGVTWDGTGADNKWMTGLNWGGVAPVGGDSLLFSGTTKLTADNDFVVDTSFAGITFNSNAGAFILSGNRITLGGDLINNSASLQTLNLALILDATRTFNAASGNVIVSSIISGTGELIKTGSGNLTLSGTASNTYAGLTSVNGGVLTLDKSAGVDAIAGNLEITSGGKVVFARSHQLKDSTIVTLSGVGSIFNGTAVNEGMPNSMVETIAGLTATGGTFNAGSNSNWTITGAGSFTGGAGNTLFVGNSGARLSFGSLSITGMTATAGGNVALANTFTLYGNSTVLSTITVGSGGLTLDGSRINLRRGGVGMSGSRLVLNGNVTVTGTTASNITEDISGGTAGVVNLELSGTTAPVDREFNVGVGGLTINVAITNGSSSAAGVTKTGNGTLTFSGGHANTYAGTTYINGGTLCWGRRMA
jgi:fibronectin-binding autotransporter adhesin